MAPARSCRIPDMLEGLSRDPEGFVLKDERATLTGGAIASGVERLAGALRERGVGRGERVAVLCGRGTSSVLAMLGVWSAAGIYVPISAENTATRVGRIIDDARVLLTIVGDETFVERFGLAGRPVLSAREVLAEALPKKAAADAQVPDGDDTAYICYTSGSTGQPKGVMIAHSSVRRLLESTRALLPSLGRDEIYLQTSDYSFDISIWNVLVWLLNGGTLVSAHFESNVAKMIALLLEHKPTFLLNAAPTYALLMASKPLWRRHDLSSPRTIITTASYCLPKTAQEILRTFPRARLFNGYGPTETTVYCCMGEITENAIDLDKPLTIGNVLPGNRAWLYDGSRLRPARDVEEGERAELCLSGEHVCQGYWRADRALEEKFLASNDGERVYRTGDLVSRHGDGFHYWGRLDDTIKIKGYRVNLGEIERCLGASDAVSACVVLDVPAGPYQTELVALYAPKGGAASGSDSVEAQLLALCRRELPAYMVPARIMLVREWPMTTSGKIDRLALKKRLARPDA